MTYQTKNGLELVATITSRQGSWRYQVRGERVIYRPRRDRHGLWRWYRAESLGVVSCGNIRSGAHAPDAGQHRRLLTDSEVRMAESITRSMGRESHWTPWYPRYAFTAVTA